MFGITWDVRGDAFRFQSTAGDTIKGPVTRQKMLSALASIYDPLGFLNPLIIQDKIILQATQMKTAWDEEVAPALQSKWTDWMSSLRLRFSDSTVCQTGPV